MKRISVLLLYGYLTWFAALAISMAIYPLKKSGDPLFETVMTLTVVGLAMLATLAYFRRVRRFHLLEGLSLGAALLLVNLVLDLPLFLFGPMARSLMSYLGDVGLTYFVYPIVTVGSSAEELGAALNARGQYADALFLHGLAVSAAEGLAEWHHGKVRRELGVAPDRGKRYSFGYSACPDLADQAKLFRLLDPEDAIGVTLTGAFQLVPEASTSALVVHLPQAAYYLVKV